jgi:plastocyanin
MATAQPHRLARAAILGCVLATNALPGLAAPVKVTVSDASGAPLVDAVVSIEVTGARTLAPAGTQAEMGQRGRSFVPTLLVVQTGTSVSFPNFDTVRHHVYSFSSTKPFEIKLYAGTPAAPIVFDKPGTAVLGCNIHDRMTAFIHVVNTPHFATTRADGAVALDVPAGDHTVQVWHPQFGDKQVPLRQAIKVSASGANMGLRLPAPSKP